MSKRKRADWCSIINEHDWTLPAQSETMEHVFNSNKNSTKLKRTKVRKSLKCERQLQRRQTI